MRVTIQRVAEASVTIGQTMKSRIGLGLLVLAGFENADNDDDLAWMAGKIASLRIFEDAKGLMNLSIKDVEGDILAVSQFTLFASTKKGNRPSFIDAARPEVAVPLYENFVARLSRELGKSVSTGEFGAYMKVALINDGPVTIHIDSRRRE